MDLACRSAVLLPEEPLCVQLLLRERKAKVCRSGEEPYPVSTLHSSSGDSGTWTLSWSLLNHTTPARNRASMAAVVLAAELPTASSCVYGRQWQCLGGTHAWRRWR